jgi:hypothetical protein
MQQRRNRRKRRYAVPIAGLFIGLAAFGVVTVVYLCFRLTGRVLDNSTEKLMFENLVRPLVMFDPAPFEQPADISPENLLMYSMWATLMSEKRDTYTISETGELMVPASDLNVAAAKLFGPDVTLQHQSFGDYETNYTYEPPEPEGGGGDFYSMPVTLQLNAYQPEVQEITKQGELYEIHVGYIPSGISWQTDFSGGLGHAVPEKYMNYIMQKTAQGYSIVKLQYPPGELGPAQVIANQQNLNAASPAA